MVAQPTGKTIVNCRSDSSYAEKPVAFLWEEQRHNVEKIINRWRTPDGNWFLVETLSGALFTLHYHISSDLWYIRQT